jgi:hypothetical protein
MATIDFNVYAPSREPTTLRLYDLMNQDPPTEEVLEQYKQMVTSLPTQNPYSGVLFNPRGCEVDQANTEIDDIIKTPDLPAPIVDELEDAKDSLDQFKEHTDRLIANFPTISSIVQSEIGNNVAALQAENPCLGFGDIMGSILDAGRQIMNEILAAIADIKNNLSAAEDLIQNAINKLKAAIAAAMTKLKEEVEKMALAMLNMAKMNLAQILKYQMQDPCLKAILDGSLTGGAKAAMGV